ICRFSPLAINGLSCYFFNQHGATDIYLLSLHDALPIYPRLDYLIEVALHERIRQGVALERSTERRLRILQLIEGSLQAALRRVFDQLIENQYLNQARSFQLLAA